MTLNFPQNFKEAVIASIPNCTVMVLGMMTLNLWIYGHLTWSNFLGALVPIYLTAFLLDFFVVGPLVMRMVRRFNIVKFMPIFRVGLMAGILTGLAPIIETGHAVSWAHYALALPRNYVVALCLQVFVALRFGSYVLGRYRIAKQYKVAKLEVRRQ